MKTEAELGEHARADVQCQTLPQPLKWIPREVVTKLKDRKKAFAGQTDEDMWRYIYGLLFPDSVHIPSPCKSNVGKLSAAHPIRSGSNQRRQITTKIRRLKVEMQLLPQRGMR